jgi:hypothetical protein
MSEEQQGKLSKDYVYELIACCLKSKKVLDVCTSHLKYEFLQTDAQKKVVKYIFDTYTLRQSAPTFGQIAQVYALFPEVIAFLGKVKKVKIEDGKEVGVLDTFEDFIKDMRFQQLYHKLAKTYNDGNTSDAIALMTKESKSINDFTIKPKKFSLVFGQFDDRQRERETRAQSDDSVLFQKLTTGIHPFDQYIKGGYRKGTSFLGMAQSGKGKSTYLRWTAMCNARLGKKVVVFQGEDTEDAAMDAFDAIWTGVTVEDVEMANVPEDLLPKIKAVRSEIMRRGGEIIMVPSEQFDKQTIEECNDIIDEIEKVVGPIDMALWDYLEIYSTKGQWGKAESSERRRREDIAEKITSIATSRKIVTGTMTQSMDIDQALQQNPDFHMTRSHASEFKNIVKPFSYFFTFNATPDEYQAQHLRIWLDKIRKHPANKSIKIVQAREYGRFYDAIKTKVNFAQYNAVNV